MNFKIEYNKKISRIDKFISDYLDTYTLACPEIIDAMKYSVLNGGKRLRSVLCTEICVMLGGRYEKALPFACSMELIHAYSLVHDDLPAMDNADYRRGQLSCHKKYGEAMGILCGDALLNSAYELMSESCETSADITAMKTLSKSAGVEGMISGQVKDLNIGSNNNVKEDVLIDLIEQKTMAIIKSSILAGSIIADADSKILEDMSAFAYHLGLAFQIRDDFEDIDEDNKNNNDSPNFINALGIEDAGKLLKFHSKSCMNIISNYKNNEFIIELLKYLFA